jgi:hydrogenase maturation factor HypF (carbamoyltransferase family)
MGDTLRTQVNALRIIRSGMSFSLADLDALTLSYGYVDSLGYFISDTLDRIQEEFKTTHVALCGSLFANRRLAETVARHAKVTHTVCFNNEFPVEY